MHELLKSIRTNEERAKSYERDLSSQIEANGDKSCIVSMILCKRLVIEQTSQLLELFPINRDKILRKKIESYEELLEELYTYANFYRNKSYEISEESLAASDYIIIPIMGLDCLGIACAQNVVNHRYAQVANIFYTSSEQTKETLCGLRKIQCAGKKKK